MNRRLCLNEAKKESEKQNICYTSSGIDNRKKYQLKYDPNKIMMKFIMIQCKRALQHSDRNYKFTKSGPEVFVTITFALFFFILPIFLAKEAMVLN